GLARSETGQSALRGLARSETGQSSGVAFPPRWRLALAAGLLALTLLLAGCTTPKQLGERPAPTAQEAAEIYLQRYQPGPLPRIFETTRITDRRGSLLAELWEEGRRTWLPLSRISPHLIDATIATEDATFYSNLGIDPARIAGAALQNAQQGDVVSGASTITMQLARNLFLGPDDRYSQNMDRKMLEAGLAQELTTLFSKDELLEMYLNLLNYGHLAYGPEAASQVYFGKSAAELSLAEATLLAGIPQQPANLDPLKNFDAARARQRVVLDLMVRHGKLSLAQADAAYAQPLAFNPQPDRRIVAAPHFVQYASGQAQTLLGEQALARSGWQITTTLDLPMQTLAQERLTARVAELQPQFDLSNAALVALRPGSGQILAMVGSADFADAAIAGQVNVALSPRQPGSAIKPMLYATAFEDNLISPASVLWDVPVTYTVSAGNVYVPANYDLKFHGPVTARTALASSYNIPAVKLLDAVTVGRMLESAQAMGLKSLARDPNWYGLSLTLGGGEVTLLDLTSAFATLANSGTYVEPTPFLALADGLGRPLQPPQAAISQAISPAAAWQVTDILADNAARAPAFGVNNPLRLSRPAAAKTGTTSDWRDNWTVGFTRYLAAGVWAGNSDGRPMRNTSGLTGAAPIWQDFMQAVLDDPELLAALEAGDDPAAWQFQPPADMARASGPGGLACPPGLLCREGGDFYSRAWLEATAADGPLADSVALVPSAPVYVDRGQGGQWAAYCQMEPAALRPLLRLPAGVGLSLPAGAEANARVQREREEALAWTLRHPTAVNLGRCDDLAATLAPALALDARPDEPAAQVLVDLAAAMDPNAGPVAGDSAAPVATAGSSAGQPGRFSLSEPVSHHAACPGNYILGQVLDAAGAPLAGVQISLVDQWGNRADAWSKESTGDFGSFDFPINYFPNQYTLTIVDSAGAPLSAPVTIDHLQGEGGDAPCHTVIWRGG
ncbi:MAG: transglycosylase domain-containing protein, partial [Anaerolinea sp.]|nr:transglycosylase domain-containing protein [Anaerolinea sp.]